MNEPRQRPIVTSWSLFVHQGGEIVAAYSYPSYEECQAHVASLTPQKRVGLKFEARNEIGEGAGDIRFWWKFGEL